MFDEMREKTKLFLYRNKWVTIVEIAIAIFILIAIEIGWINQFIILAVVLYACLSLWLRGKGWRDFGLKKPENWKKTILLALLVGMIFQALSLYVIEPLLGKLTGDIPPDPRTFKLFVGCVLLYIGVRLLYEFTGKARAQSQANKALEKKFKERADEIKKRQTSMVAAGLPPEALVKTVSATLTRIEYEFWGERFSYSTIGMFILAFVVGIIGGTYGIGGGAIIALFCVAGFHLPVYTIAGAALMGTFITSIAGVFFYSVIPAKAGMATSPDWLLGEL